MYSSERRKKIKALLKNEKKPISASVLSKKFGVSRQAIVGDIAILRASGIDILSTSKGYVMNSSKNDNSLIFKIPCEHNFDLSKQELYAIVDNGGIVLDVTVDHPIYGELIGRLNIRSRLDIDDFFYNIEKNNIELLSSITKGVHLHTISCETPRAYEKIIYALKNLNILYSN